MKHPFSSEDMEAAGCTCHWWPRCCTSAKNKKTEHKIDEVLQNVWDSAVARGVVRHFEQGGDIHACAIIKLPKEKT